MSLITLAAVGKDYGPHTILENLQAQVARGEKIGIVGKNGGGKTTLVKLLVGLEQPSRGTVRIARGIRIGYLSQIARLDDTKTVREEADTALSALADAENELRDAESTLAAHPDDPELLEAYAAARDRFEFAGGDNGRDQLAASLAAMGFDDADLDKTVGVLSGGEKTRLAMVQLLASTPEVLILDEPTNHLDIRAVEWLEGFLQRFPGAVLLVSHDRRFLQAVVNTIWEMDAGSLTSYRGDYETYRTKREAARARQLDEYLQQQAHIAKTEEFIRRNKAGQNTRIAMGRQKLLDRLERIERPAEDPKRMAASLQSTGRSGLETVVCERASKRFGEQVILDNASFTIHRGDKIGIVGPNGAGKSTLVEMIVGAQQPDQGIIACGSGVRIAVRQQDEDDFDPERTVLENLHERSSLTVGEARSHLARFLFTGDDVFKPVSALSGGERAKLAMAAMVLGNANLLILDEPTNHLDVFSCDALSEALVRYDGTLVVVSHDRALLDAVTNRTLALDGLGKATLFDGNYAAWRATQATPPISKTAPPSKSATKSAPTITDSKPANAHEASRQRRRMQQQLATVESEIASIEAEIARIEAGLSAPESADVAMRLATEHAAALETLERRMEEWARIGEELETL